MSYGRAMASLAIRLLDTMPAIKTKLGLADFDIDVLATTPTRYGSLRLQDLGGMSGENDAAALAQLDIRTPYDFDSWTVWQLQDEIEKALELSRRTQVFRSFLPLLDFNKSDDTPPVAGRVRVDLLGGQLWQKRNDRAAGQNQYWLRLQLTYD